MKNGATLMPSVTALVGSVTSVVRNLAGENSGTLTDTLVIDFANAASMKMRKMMIENGIDAAHVAIGSITLTDGVGIYSYPDDMFYVPKYIEVNWWDTSDSGKWKQAGSVAEVALPPDTTISYLRDNQDSNQPLIDYRGDTFEIFPTPQASFWGGVAGSTYPNAINIFYYTQPTLYKSVSDSLSFPESLDYFSFARLIKAYWDVKMGKLPEQEIDGIFQLEVGKFIKMIKVQVGNPQRARGIRTTGWEY